MMEDRSLSLRQQVGQLFIVRPESLEPAIRYDSDAELPPYRLQAVSGGMITGKTMKFTRNNKAMCFLTVEDLLLRFRAGVGRALDNDRMLLS